MNFVVAVLDGVLIDDDSSVRYHFESPLSSGFPFDSPLSVVVLSSCNRSMSAFTLPFRARVNSIIESFPSIGVTVVSFFLPSSATPITLPDPLWFEFSFMKWGANHSDDDGDGDDDDHDDDDEDDDGGGMDVTDEDVTTSLCRRRIGYPSVDAFINFTESTATVFMEAVAVAAVVDAVLAAAVATYWSYSFDGVT